MPVELTEQQRRAVRDQAGGPVEIIDPDTHHTYVLLTSEQYRQMRLLVQSDTVLNEPGIQLSPGILHSQEAFWRDLPQLLSQPKWQGRWVCYHGSERIGVGSYEDLIRLCQSRGIPDDAFYLAMIRPRENPPWEPEEVEALGLQHREDGRPEQ